MGREGEVRGGRKKRGGKLGNSGRVGKRGKFRTLSVRRYTKGGGSGGGEGRSEGKNGRGLPLSIPS